MLNSLCPSCGNTGYGFTGNKKAKNLLIFNKPYIIPAIRGYKDRVSGLDVLRKEMAKCGMDLLSDFRLSWLWLHEPNGNDDCYLAGKSIVLDEAKGKECVVLVGSEPCEEFTDMYASDILGLQVDSPVLSAPIVFVIPKPEGVFVQGAGVGELRLSIQKLGRMLNND